MLNILNKKKIIQKKKKHTTKKKKKTPIKIQQHQTILKKEIQVSK
jgi:hypothetical protein